MKLSPVELKQPEKKQAQLPMQKDINKDLI
jgi:hypothetical protein